MSAQRAVGDIHWEESPLPVEIDETTRREIADRVAAEHTNWADALRAYGREVAKATREAAGVMRENQGVFEIEDQS